jgi:cell division septation protein DedD
MPAPVNTPATPIVAVQTPPPAGSYVVQVAAQKSEAEAQASWQSLQQRYSTVLAGQQAAIRRVDLGERGVFYRAQVGPFSSRAQASEVCQSLKAAGGECVIQRN